MTRLELGVSPEDAKILVKEAFERAEGIDKYVDEGARIVGKTGMGLGSYGEEVTVDIPEGQEDKLTSVIDVTAKKEVELNITADPQKYKSRFLRALNDLRDQGIGDVRAKRTRSNKGRSREVESAEEFGSPTNRVAVVIAISMIILFLFMFFTFIALMP